jgi:hypothetical protein
MSILVIQQYNEEEEKLESLATKQLQLKALEEKWKVRHLLFVQHFLDIQYANV